MSSHKRKVKGLISIVFSIAVIVLAGFAFGSIRQGKEKSVGEAANQQETLQKKGCVIFLHSGGFVIEKNDFHESFGKAMGDALGYDYVVPDYPVNQTYKETVAYMEEVYKKAAEEYEEVLLVGCSAGANLAVSTIISYGEEYGMPSGLILMSPWMDTAMKNKDIECVSDFDKEFFDSLVEWGGHYNSGETENELASPINASKEQLKHFPKTVMIVGTEDILRYDAEKFYQNLIDAGVDVEYLNAEGKNHGEVFAEYASTYVMPELMTKAMGYLAE